MNWKTLCVIAGLILTTSLAACSNAPADSENQADPAASPATENVAPGATTESPDATKSDDAKTETTKSDDAKTEKDATKSDDAKTKEDATKTEDSTTKP